MAKLSRQTLRFKEGFIDRIKDLTDVEAFKEASLKYPRKAIRVNTLKISITELKKTIGDSWTLEQIPWCKEGFWITHKEGRRDVGNLPEHSLGYFYIQDASSMLPPIVLGPKPHEHILDMAASPGSKSTQIASMMKNTGVLVCNDYKGSRLAALGINLQRTGVSNVIISLSQGQYLKPMQFDRILLDAPCSGTGTISKSLKTMVVWNANVIKRLSTIQGQLITKAYSLLKPGGVLVYSTCSVDPEENENVIDFLLGKHPEAELGKIDLPLKRSPAIMEFNGKKYDKRIKNCLRIWPQDNETEGFFITKIIKP